MTPQLLAGDRHLVHLVRAVGEARTSEMTEGLIDAAAVFLLARASAFMTGQALVVDGGLTTRA